MLLYTTRSVAVSHHWCIQKDLSRLAYKKLPLFTNGPGRRERVRLGVAVSNYNHVSWPPGYANGYRGFRRDKVWPVIQRAREKRKSRIAQIAVGWDIDGA